MFDQGENWVLEGGGEGGRPEVKIMGTKGKDTMTWEKWTFLI